ncbi:putative exo-1,4-beta-xylosidase bxlB [Paramyrothecium foliicola]|nr:putative exo-1,4-beta-xylosidase bxlB [Paramyrothecium foliicola]
MLAFQFILVQAWGVFLGRAATVPSVNTLRARACLPATEYSPEYTYEGCYTDPDSKNRALKGRFFTSTQNSARYCTQLCGRLGYTLAGLEYTNQCFCGDELDPISQKTDESACGRTCPGNSTEKCGDSYKMNLYLINNAVDREGPGTFPDCNRDPLCSNPVCDTSLSPKERATGLINAFTIDEKLANRVNGAAGALRLGLLPYQWWNEALHGLAQSHGSYFAGKGEWSYATSFPQPIVLGAAFDDKMVRAVADVISTEVRAFHNVGRSGINLYTPNINNFKDPRWGRGQETPGEDPFHAQRYTRAIVSGLEDASTGYKKTVTTCKHYVANDFENFGSVSRYNFDANITLQDLSEFYLPPFKTCALEQKAGSFMCSYNGVNGHPLCANRYLLEDVLRQHWDWEADEHFISTDCEAVPYIFNRHGYAKDLGEASAVALKAGTDLECNNRAGYEAITSAWNQSLVTEEEIDKSLIRMWSSLVSLGFFDPTERQPLRGLGWKDVHTKDAEKLAYDSAIAGSVLIKNNDFLPLDPKKQQKFAFIGPWFNATKELQGIYSGPAPYTISPRQAAEERKLSFDWQRGVEMNATDASFNNAIEIARDADVVVFWGGIDNSLERESNDRQTLAWPDAQTQLLEKLSEVGKPVVIVQFGGGQVDDTALLADDNVKSILWVGYPGQAGGRPIFDLLFGKAAPAGRLPITQYPASYFHDAPPTDMNLRPAPGNSNLGRTHIWYNGKAPVPFGFGLHYTEFEAKLQRKPNLKSAEIKSLVPAKASNVPAEWQKALEREVIHVPITITNVGSVKSDYVVLLFMRSEVGPLPRPIKTLVGYERIKALSPGKEKSVSISVTVENLVRVDEQGNRVLHPGKYTVFADLDEKVVHEFELKGTPTTVEYFPQPN